MPRFKSLLLAVSLAVLPLPLMAATPGAVQVAQSPAMPGPDAGAGRHHGGKLAGLLSPEQRAAFMVDARQQTRDMNPDQRRAWRKDQIRKLTAMSDSERQTFRDGLQAKWDALPADTKARIQARIAQRGQAAPAR